MENGFDGRSLAEKFSELGVSATSAEQSNSHNHGNNNDSNLFQVLKAVEAAEATIKQQVEENNRLRIELQKKIQELEKYMKCSTWDLTYLLWCHGLCNMVIPSRTKKNKQSEKLKKASKGSGIWSA